MALLPPRQQITTDSFIGDKYRPSLNRATRLVTHGKNVILDESMFSIERQTWSTAKVNPGVIVKDDVVIHINDEYTLDFLDHNYYLDDGEQAMIQTGYYYIVIDYTYYRKHPAPEAYYKIIRDDFFYVNYAHQYIYIGNVYIEWNHLLSQFELSSTVGPFYNHPTHISNIKRSIVTDHADMLDCGTVLGNEDLNPIPKHLPSKYEPEPEV